MKWRPNPWRMNLCGKMTIRELGWLQSLWATLGLSLGNKNILTVMTFLSRFQVSVSAEPVYPSRRTRWTVTSSWATSPCTACASPWCASSSSFASSWSACAAARTREPPSKMGWYRLPPAAPTLVCATRVRFPLLAEHANYMLRLKKTKLLFFVCVTVRTYHHSHHHWQHIYSVLLWRFSDCFNVICSNYSWYWPSCFCWFYFNLH